MVQHYYLLFAQCLLVILVLVMLWLITRSYRQLLLRLKVEASRAETISRYLLAGMVLWLMILAVLAYLGYFADFQTLPPKIFLALLPPIALVVYLLFSRRFTRMLRLVPESWLVTVQTFRAPLEIILWLSYVGGYLPFQMTFEGFNYDIIVGLTAFMAGIVFFGRNRYRRFEAIIWNSFGLILLFNIVVISFYSTPSPYRIFMNEPANRIIAYFPFIWLPGFLVPVALAMHVFSLKQLLFMPKNKSRTFTLRKK